MREKSCSYLAFILSNYLKSKKDEISAEEIDNILQALDEEDQFLQLIAEEVNVKKITYPCGETEGGLVTRTYINKKNLSRK